MHLHKVLSWLVDIELFKVFFSEFIFVIDGVADSICVSQFSSCVLDDSV